jgi:hypothetical protein
MTLPTVPRTADGLLCTIAGVTDPGLSVSLDAVVVAVSDDEPRVLVVPGQAGKPRVPSGPLDPDDKTLERALRRWIAEQTGTQIGYAEQLYTFGDRDRARSSIGEPRELAVAYLALVREEDTAEGAEWTPLYDLFPWEDHRTGRPAAIDEVLRPGLDQWAGHDQGRRRRVTVVFGPESSWDGIRVLDRYELLYEAGLVAEAHVDRGSSPPDGCVGTAMDLDHRRIAASALGRLRGKLTYRPVVFELLPELFTLSTLQRTVEALAGVVLHTQNFRRLVERNRLVEGTGERSPSTGGRPAELFRFRPEVVEERPRPGLGVPYR